MYKNKISKEFKNIMERELRQYWDNKKKIDGLKQDSSKLASTRSILYCQERVNYIENVIKRLDDFEKDIFYLIFKEGCDSKYCETMHNISRWTYYNVYNKSIRYLAEEWGEI